MILKKLLDTWLQKYAKHTIKLRTYITYQTIIEKHIDPILGRVELDDLSQQQIQDFILKKIENGNLINGKKLSYNSVLLIVSVLKQALDFAFNQGLLKSNITSNISLPRRKEKKIEIFNEDEIKKIETFCLNTKQNYIGIVICLYTGIRIGELLALTWDDLDFEKRLLYINKSQTTILINGKTKIYVDDPKTKYSIRIIPIPKQLIPYLKKLKKNSSKYIITTKNKGMVDIRSYQKTYKSILKKLKIEYRNFHSLRHTFATRALELGMDVKSLSEILGHKNATITLNRYSHSLLSYKMEMINKLGNRISIN